MFWLSLVLHYFLLKSECLTKPNAPLLRVTSQGLVTASGDSFSCKRKLCPTIYSFIWLHWSTGFLYVDCLEKNLYYIIESHTIRDIWYYILLYYLCITLLFLTFFFLFITSATFFSLFTVGHLAYIKTNIFSQILVLANHNETFKMYEQIWTEDQLTFIYLFSLKIIKPYKLVINQHSSQKFQMNYASTIYPWMIWNINYVSFFIFQTVKTASNVDMMNGPMRRRISVFWNS